MGSSRLRVSGIRLSLLHNHKHNVLYSGLNSKGYRPVLIISQFDGNLDSCIHCKADYQKMNPGLVGFVYGESVGHSRMASSSLTKAQYHPSRQAKL